MAYNIPIAGKISEFELTDESFKVVIALHLVAVIKNADDLVQVVTSEEHDSAAREWAAAKLLIMWEDDRKGGVTLAHLAYVGDHADEPHKSQANQIIRDNI